MRLLLSRSGLAPALHSGALCVLFAACLAGCASKNPLIDDPQAASRSDAPKAQAVAPAAAPAGHDDVQTMRDKPFLGFFRPYRPDIQQGNFVSREMISQLHEGMTQDQVRFILGTPLLTDVFHANRWDYPFRIRKGNGETTASRVTLYFENNRLARIVGGDLPTEAEYLSRIAGEKAKKGDAKPTTETPSPSAAETRSPATAKP
jgi:outer membrane protein assembly factor BamE